MPYVLKRGTIYGQPYKCGDFVPGEKGSLADMETAGAVEWRDAPVREPAKKAEPKSAANPAPKVEEKPTVKAPAAKRTAKRKAVKR